MPDERLEGIASNLERLETRSEAPQPNGPDGTPSVPQPGPQKVPVKPQLLGVDIQNRAAVSTIGQAPLEASEVRAITKIASKAFKRMLQGLMEQIGKTGKPRGRKPGVKAVKAADPATPAKRRGRPRKVKTEQPADQPAANV